MRARGTRVEAIDGRGWVVRRRWVPRLGPETLWGRFRRRVRQMFRRAGDIDGGGCFDIGGIDDLVALLVLVVVAALVVFVLFPILVALLDVLLVALLTIVGVIGRVVFGRPWTIEAIGDDESRYAWHVVGWRESKALVTELADRLRLGGPLPEPGAWSVPGKADRAR